MTAAQVIRRIPPVPDGQAPPTIAAILCHADDIEYHMGGTLAKYVACGYRGIYGVLSLCNSGYAPEDSGQTVYRPSALVVPKRRAEARAAAGVFGAELFQLDLMENCYTDSRGQVIALDYPRAGARHEEPPAGGPPLASAAGAGKPGDSWGTGAVGAVAALLERCRPAMVFGQSVDALNPDHFAAAMIVHKAYREAARKVALGPFYIAMAFPGSEFYPGEPDLIVDVTGHEARAEKAFACHVSQGCARPEALAPIHERWRAWGGTIGTRSAEPFRRIL